ncbi:MAG: GH36-type glycosyl hydrolase domain-containing protein [Kiritimatiellia bacterium]
MKANYGHFDDAATAYVITNSQPPRPWINYLGNRRLRAFVSQNAGGLLWHMEPYSRRITRYHYTAAPGDRPGFYLYVRDRRTGAVWNPHFAPTCTALDAFECRHRPGVTEFVARKDGVEVCLTLGIPPDDDVLLWQVRVRNTGLVPADLQLVNFLEFGLLEFMREALGWCYLKNQFELRYDPELGAIRYNYHVFEAPFSPAMLIGCSEKIHGWECSREAFIGKAGSYESPCALRADAELSNSDLPLGGHACAVQGVNLHLEPGAEKSLGFTFALADKWPQAEELIRKYQSAEAVTAGITAIDAFWAARLKPTVVDTGDAQVDRMVNTWIPYNCMVALDLARTISTDHMGTDGLRYRDTTQDAMAVANMDPAFALQRMRQVFASQTPDGGGCFAFFPDDPRPIRDTPRRCDNTVWQIYTIHNLIAETGDLRLLEEMIPYRDNSSGTVYEHILKGLVYIYERRGPNGLPTLYHADWNDSLALFGDEHAESVMLGMQMVYSCKLFLDVARRCNRSEDVDWCERVIAELTAILNSDKVWDGRWYRRLLFSNGKVLGSAANRQGRIYLNPQSWSVLSGVGDFENRGQMAMDAAAEMLDSDCGLRILMPPFKGIPEPEDPPLGSNPGIGENGGIFSHANTWAIMAECLLGNGNRAWKYFRQILPEVVSERFGADHYEREPYVFVSSIIGPVSNRFGEGGISWLTGTANWMHIAMLQYILGIRPTLDGLQINPCLPDAVPAATVKRTYRGKTYCINLRRQDGKTTYTCK